MVTRVEFEEMCADLFDRVVEPLDAAAQSAGITLDLIDQVSGDCGRPIQGGGGGRRLASHCPGKTEPLAAAVIACWEG